MASRDVIHEAVLQLRADTTQLRSDLAAGRGMFEGSLKGMQGLARSLVPVLSIGGIVAFGKSVVDLAGQLQDLHEQTGISAQTLSGIKSTLEENGSSVETFARGVFNLQKNLGNVDSDSDAAALAIKHLGLSLNDLRNSSPDDFIKKVIDALGNIKNPVERNTILFNLLGKSAKELGPAFQSLVGRLDELTAKGMSPEAIAKLDAFGDSWTRLGNRLQILASGPLSDFVDKFDRLFGGNTQSKFLSSQITTLDGQIAGLNQRMEKLQDSADGAIQKMYGQMKAQRDALTTTKNALKGNLAEITPPPPQKTPPPGVPLPSKANLEETKRLLAEGLKDMFAGIEDAEKKAIAGGLDMIAIFGDLDTEAMTPLERELSEINKRFDEMKIKAIEAFEATGQDAAGALNRLEFLRRQRLLAAEMPTTPTDAMDAAAGIQRFKTAQDVGLAMEELRVQMSLAGLDAAAFGSSFDSLGAKISAVQNTMRDLNRIIAEGGPAADLASAKIASLKDQLGSLESMKRLEDSVGRVFDSISNGIEQTMQGIMQGTQSLGEGLQNMLRNVMLSINQELTKMLIIEPLKEKLMGLVRGLMGTGETKPPGALEQLSGPGMQAFGQATTLQTAGFSLNAAGVSLSTAAAALSAAAAGMGAGVSGALGGGIPAGLEGPLMEGGGFFSGGGGGFDLSKIFSGITEKLSSMMSSLMDTLSSALSGLGSMFSSMFSSIGSFIMGLFDTGGFVGMGGLPSFATGGAVPILAHQGEFVMRSAAVQSIGRGAMSDVNRTGKFPEGGGQVGGPIHLHITHDYTNAVAPSDLKTKRKEVETYIIENWRKGGAVRTMIMGDKGHR